MEAQKMKGKIRVRQKQLNSVGRCLVLGPYVWRLILLQFLIIHPTQHTCETTFTSTAVPVTEILFPSANAVVALPPKQSSDEQQSSEKPQPNGSIVHAASESFVQPAQGNNGQPTEGSTKHPAPENTGQKEKESSKHPANVGTVPLPIKERKEQSVEVNIKQPTQENCGQPAEGITKQPAEEIDGQRAETSSKQSTTESNDKLAKENNEQLAKENPTWSSKESIELSLESNLHHEKSKRQPTTENNEQPVKENMTKPTNNVFLQQAENNSDYKTAKETFVEQSGNLNNKSIEHIQREVHLGSNHSALLKMPLVENAYTKNIITAEKVDTSESDVLEKTEHLYENALKSSFSDVDKADINSSVIDALFRSNFDSMGNLSICNQTHKNVIADKLCEGYLYTNTTMSNTTSPVVSVLESCVERCGDYTTHPCSCNEKCVVHKNCCEDIASACLEIHSNSLMKFQHLLTATVRCDPRTLVFMVQSCPISAEKEATSSEKPLKADVAHQILSNAPVTDLDTGIVYANSSVYKCNKKLDNSSSKQSGTFAKGIWKTQIAVKNPDDLLVMNDQSDLLSYLYLPPETPPQSAGSLCHNSWTLNCISGHFNQTGVNQAICNLSVNEYYSWSLSVRTMPLSELLDQDICARCFSDYQITFLNSRYFSFEFKVMMSLSEISGEVVYRVVDELKKHRASLLPWSSWTCSYPQNTTLPATPNKPICKVVQCGKNFRISPEGVCRKVVFIEFLNQDGFLFSEKKCTVDTDVFAKFSLCLAQDFLNLKATETPYKSFKQYKKFWNQNMTVIRREMYFDVDDIENQILDIFYQEDEMLYEVYYFVSQYCTIEYSPQETKSSFAWKQSVQKKSLQSENSSSVILFSFCMQFEQRNGYLEDGLFCDVFKEIFLSDISFLLTNDPIFDAPGQKCFTKRSTVFKSKGDNLKPLKFLSFCVILMVLW